MLYCAESGYSVDTLHPQSAGKTVANGQTLVAAAGEQSSEQMKDARRRSGTHKFEEINGSPDRESERVEQPLFGPGTESSSQNTVAENEVNTPTPFFTPRKTPLSTTYIATMSCLACSSLYGI